MSRRHQPVPTPEKGIGKWGVKDQRTGQVRQAGASKEDAKQLAKDWNRGEKR